MDHLTDLTGQVALITGGGRGIGRNIAQQLAAAGATVAVAARTISQLDETIESITTNGGKAVAFQMDVTNNDEVTRVVSEITKTIGPIDLLINNAGISNEAASFWQADPAKWWRVFEVNVRGVFICTQAVLATMVTRGQGRIINIGSNAGIRPSPMASDYGASKAALLHLSNSIGAELSETNVSIFTISPGLVYTDMTKDIEFFKGLPKSAWTPIERAGEICVLLASGAADKLSGRYFHVKDDDLLEMIARADEVIEENAYALHLRRLSSE